MDPVGVQLGGRRTRRGVPGSQFQAASTFTWPWRTCHRRQGAGRRCNRRSAARSGRPGPGSSWTLPPPTPPTLVRGHRPWVLPDHGRPWRSLLLRPDACVALPRRQGWRRLGPLHPFPPSREASGVSRRRLREDGQRRFYATASTSASAWVLACWWCRCAPPISRASPAMAPWDVAVTGFSPRLACRCAPPIAGESWCGSAWCGGDRHVWGSLLVRASHRRG
ncbi:hypothetical protein BDA96_03G094200 [Sorghum bicolor]|uniref:Uncharacterized protein n=1 Tax=Sorghum bicolor TaxID=4558 RepID=A0A921UMR7_SORBI|nr:hypothetical protein BDA96_03G094200 [Sorghum bicolor]